MTLCGNITKGCGCRGRNLDLDLAFHHIMFWIHFLKEYCLRAKYSVKIIKSTFCFSFASLPAKNRLLPSSDKVRSSSLLLVSVGGSVPGKLASCKCSWLLRLGKEIVICVLHECWVCLCEVSRMLLKGAAFSTGLLSTRRSCITRTAHEGWVLRLNKCQNDWIPRIAKDSSRLHHLDKAWVFLWRRRWGGYEKYVPGSFLIKTRHLCITDSCSPEACAFQSKSLK